MWSMGLLLFFVVVGNDVREKWPRLTGELSPGTAVSLHVGVAGKGVTVASDLVGPGLLEGDVCVTPLGYTNGGLEVGRFRGLGLELSEEQLTHYRV